MYEDEFELTFQVPEEESAPEPLAAPAAKPAAPVEPVVDEPTRIMTLEKPAAPVVDEPTRGITLEKPAEPPAPEPPAEPAPEPVKEQPAPAAPAAVRRVLISGGDRGIGAAAARAFAAAGYQVAVLYHPGEHKGFSDAFAALEIARKRVPDLVANVFGGAARPEWLPEWCRYTRNASQEKLRSIYSRSAVFLCASVNEGFALTCPEAMFCGCALVSTDFQGVHEYANDECALLSPVHNPEALAANLVRLLLDPAEARAIAALGTASARRECSMAHAYGVINREFGVKD